MIKVSCRCLRDGIVQQQMEESSAETYVFASRWTERPPGPAASTSARLYKDVCRGWKTKRVATAAYSIF